MLTDSLQRGLREREEHARGRQTSTVNFIPFFRRCSVFRSFAISPASPDIYRCYLFAVIHYLSFLQLYVFFYTREISNLEKKKDPSSPKDWIKIREREREREREGCKRPIRYPIRGPRMPSTSLTARQTPDRRLE